MSNKVSVLGFDVFSSSVGALASEIERKVFDEGQKGWLCCLNPHSYAVTKSLETFKLAVRAANWVVPDGVGIVIAGEWLRQPIQERITGSDVFNAISDIAERRNLKVFFLGASEEVLTLIVERYARDFPRSKIVGTYSPPFKATFDEADIDAMRLVVNSVKPDILWVGMTSPKQDIFIAENFEQLNVGFAAGIGAVFDFYAGRTPRANALMIRLKLEWLHRLVMSPKRMWRRVFISGPIFLFYVIKSWSRL